MQRRHSQRGWDANPDTDSDNRHANADPNINHTTGRERRRDVGVEEDR